MEPLPTTLEESHRRIRALENQIASLESLDAEGRLAKERLNLSLSAGQVAWWEMDVATGTVDANEWKPRMLGRDPGEFAFCHYSKYTGLIHPEDYPGAMKAMADHLHGNAEVYECEYRIRHSNGSWCWFYDKGSVTSRSPEGRPLTVKGVVLDITSRKENEQRLERALKEKSFLLREIHHRIKNNLNLISMVIFHMEDRFPDKDMREALRKLTNRIASMASLHQLLHRDDQVDRIDLGEYLEDLVQGILHSLTLGGGLSLNIHRDSLVINHNYSLKLGLLVNELVTNALKYGLSGRTSGVLELRLQALEEGFLLEVANDGPPLNLERWSGSDSLGKRLITGFTQELGGILEIENSPGPRFKFRFPPGLLALGENREDSIPDSF